MTSGGPEVQPGLELLLRVVAQGMEARPCAGCGSPLSNSRIGVREQDAATIVVEVRCRGCGESTLLRIEPEAGDGVARVG